MMQNRGCLAELKYSPTRKGKSAIKPPWFIFLVVLSHQIPCDGECGGNDHRFRGGVKNDRKITEWIGRNTPKYAQKASFPEIGCT